MTGGHISTMAEPGARSDTTGGVAALVYAGETAEELEASGALTIEGDRDALARFATLFPPPTRVPSK